MEIDRKTLKALGADTRLDILKSLKERRKTPSELSRELKLSSPTILEHLSKLGAADLVVREETGHKWIYYNLTRKGLNLVKPRVPVPLVLVLGLAIILVFSFMFVPQFFYTSSNFALERGTLDSAETGAMTSQQSEESIPPNITENVTDNTTTIS